MNRVSMDTNVLKELPQGERVVWVPTNRYFRVLELLEKAFPDTSRTFFHSITQKDPWYNSRFSLAIEFEKRYLSHVQIFDRILLIEQNPVRYGGIGSVGTHPDHEGKGYATILLKEALSCMEKEGMQGSMLFTKIQPFYEKLGWRTLEQQEQEISLDSLIPFQPRQVCHRTLREKDYDTLYDMYCQRYDSVDGLLKRTKEYWRIRAEWMDHRAVVVLNDGQIVAYFYLAQYDLQKPVIHITEYGYLKPEADILSLLMGVMARKVEELNAKSVRGFFQADPALREWVNRHDLEWKHRPNRYMMWQDLNDSGLLQTIQQKIEQDRWIYWTTDAF